MGVIRKAKKTDKIRKILVLGERGKRKGEKGNGKGERDKVFLYISTSCLQGFEFRT